MKAQSLWPKHDYAWIDGRGRNEQYRASAKRIQIKRVYKVEPRYGGKNAATYVDAFLLNHDGSFANQELTLLRAYDIVDFWDDWWAEHGEKIEQYKAYVAQLETDRLSRMKERENIEAALKSAHPLFAQADSIVVRSNFTDVTISNRLVKEILNLEHVSAA